MDGIVASVPGFPFSIHCAHKLPSADTVQSVSMQRSMELIREILFALDRHAHGFAPPKIEIGNHSDEEIGFHIHLMGQAKLLDTIDVTTHGDKSPQALASAITWEGYDFLEAAKNDAIWKKATDTLSRNGMGVTLEILKALLVDLAKQAIGIK